MDDKKINDIKAVVAELVKIEDGINKHQQGIAELTPKLVHGRYRLGSLLMALPGARADLRQAKGEWLKKCVAVCGNKDRVYVARDTFDFFEHPHDPGVRALGTTGEERATAFRGTLGELEAFIHYMKVDAAHARKRERERQAEEDARTVERRNDVVPQDTASRYMVLHSEDENEPSDVNSAESTGIQVRPRMEVVVEPAGVDARDTQTVVGTFAAPAMTEDESNRRAQLASDLIDLCGYDVQQAILYLIEKHWNMADALKCLEDLVEETAMPDAPASQPDADATDEEVQTPRTKPSRTRKAGGRRRASTDLAVAGA